VLTLGVLVSGTGSNLQAILNAIAAGTLPCRVGVVVSNRPQAPALARAERAGVPTHVVDHRRYATREAFDAVLAAILQQAGVELVVLAGFDRLLTPAFLDPFAGRVLNIHPALLPAFKGLRAQRQAIDYGVRVSGATVHFVDAELDHGPIVLQAAVAVAQDDTEESLARRILEVEHRIYPEAIRLFAEGKLTIEGRRVRIAGGNAPLPPPLLPV